MQRFYSFLLYTHFPSTVYCTLHTFPFYSEDHTSLFIIPRYPFILLHSILHTFPLALHTFILYPQCLSFLLYNIRLHSLFLSVLLWYAFLYSLHLSCTLHTFSLCPLYTVQVPLVSTLRTFPFCSLVDLFPRYPPSFNLFLPIVLSFPLCS
jgi:hypothetical protein